jgi:hypothetical protein
MEGSRELFFSFIDLNRIVSDTDTDQIFDEYSDIDRISNEYRYKPKYLSDIE